MYRILSGMRFAICNETYQDTPFDEDCAHVAACGYDGIEIAPFTFDDDPSRITEQQATTLGKTAAAAGLAVVGLHWLLVKPPGLHITTPDDAVREHTIAFVEHLTRLCAAMGGNVLVFGSPKQRNLAEGQAYDDAMRRGVDSFRRICETAQPLGVTLALEPLGPAETNFMSSSAETVRIIEAVDHPACQLHLDVKERTTEAESIRQIIARCAKHMAHVQANDANMRGPGFGDVDFLPIAQALKAANYDGYVSVEVFDYKPDAQTIARKSIDYLKKTFAAAGAV